MTKEQREAVEMLRRLPSFDMDELLLQILDGAGLREASKALNTLIALLAPPDENHRAVVKFIENPHGMCENCCYLEWEDSVEQWLCSEFFNTWDAGEVATPAGGCPWHEEEA